MTQFTTRSTGFRRRITLFATLVCVISVLAVALAGYTAIRNLEFERAKTALLSELRAAERVLLDGGESVVDDLRFMTGAPAARGMAGHLADSSVTAAPGETGGAYWRIRVKRLFASMHAARESYVSMRFVDTRGATARVALRVDKVDGIATSVDAARDPRETLDALAASAEALEADAHFRAAPDFFTRGGAPVEPRVSVVEQIMPVVSRSGERVGFIAIAVDTARARIEAFADSGITHEVVVFRGDLAFAFAPAGRTAAFHSGDFPERLSRLIASVPETGRAPTVVDASDMLVAAVKMPSEAYNGRDVRLAVFAPTEDVYAGSAAASTRMALTGLATLLLAATAAGIGVFRFTRPILELERAVGVAGRTGSSAVLPTHRPDEIGHLARSFAGLIAAVERRGERERVILDTLFDGIVVFDAHGVVERANATAAALLGRTPETLLWEDIVDLVLPRRRRRPSDAVFARAMRRLSRGVTDRRLEREDGREVFLEVSVSQIEARGEPRFACVLRDVTERRRQAAEVERLVEDLKSSNAELDTFAYVASHDLKAPLRTIENVSSWIEEDLGEAVDPDTRENLDLLRSRVARMSALLDALLEHSRIGRKRGETAPPIVTGDALAATLQDLVNPPERVTLTFTAGFRALAVAQTPFMVVVLNLVSNAVKHHDRPDGTITVDAAVDRGWATVSVADDGPGIEPAYQERVFELFQTLRPRDEVEGSGMGLAIARKHVQVEGGRIWLRSEGRGTTFSFTWPVAEPAARAA